MDLEQARANVKNILQGKTINHAPTLAEAKERLRTTDPGIDISRFTSALNNGCIFFVNFDLLCPTQIFQVNILQFFSTFYTFFYN